MVFKIASQKCISQSQTTKSLLIGKPTCMMNFCIIIATITIIIIIIIVIVNINMMDDLAGQREQRWSIWVTKSLLWSWDLIINHNGCNNFIADRNQGINSVAFVCSQRSRCWSQHWTAPRVSQDSTTLGRGLHGQWQRAKRTLAHIKWPCHWRPRPYSGLCCFGVDVRLLCVRTGIPVWRVYEWYLAYVLFSTLDITCPNTEWNVTSSTRTRSRNMARLNTNEFRDENHWRMERSSPGPYFDGSFLVEDIMFHSVLCTHNVQYAERYARQTSLKYVSRLPV